VTLLADRTLAARIERSVVRDITRYAEACRALDPALPLARADFAGGLALFVAPGSPVNMIFGAGFTGPVTGADVEAVERWYSERGAVAAISLSPLADPTLSMALALRGWILTDFENVLVRELGAGEPRLPDAVPGSTIVAALTSEERRTWSRLSAAAFDAPEQPDAEVVRLGDAMAARDDSTLLTGLVGGEPAGTGALWVDEAMGWMLHDATLPALRGRGVQSALLAERTRMAQAAGCELAVTEARPGGTSQRNMERLGYRVVYTRVEMIAPPRR
jgi:GNAT superfamily N-acetyltransferase